MNRKETSRSVQNCFCMIFCCCYIFANEKSFPKDDGTSNVSHMYSSDTTGQSNNRSSATSNTYASPPGGRWNHLHPHNLPVTSTDGGCRDNENGTVDEERPPAVLEDVPARVPSPGSALGAMVTRMLATDTTKTTTHHPLQEQQPPTATEGDHHPHHDTSRKQPEKGKIRLQQNFSSNWSDDCVY
jgi:hypothetical protein